MSTATKTKPAAIEPGVTILLAYEAAQRDLNLSAAKIEASVASTQIRTLQAEIVSIQEKIGKIGEQIDKSPAGKIRHASTVVIEGTLAAVEAAYFPGMTDAQRLQHDKTNPFPIPGTQYMLQYTKGGTPKYKEVVYSLIAWIETCETFSVHRIITRIKNLIEEKTDSKITGKIVPLKMPK
jgi:hypothetical protein